VDEEGNVWVRSGDGERIVGQYAAGGSKKDALAIYVRRYLDLRAQLNLIATRIETVSPDESASALKTLEKQLVEPSAVGDIEALRTRAAGLHARIDERRAEYQAKRQQIRAAALAEKEAIVARAEEIADSVDTPINWRDTRAELMDLLERWRQAQKSGPRIDKPTSDALWKRLSHARKVFEDARRAYFHRLDAQRSQVVAAKERLIARAEEIAHSTDWRETSNEMRRIMDEWKAAGRASKKDDDRLWERFMAAREVFFSARSAHHSAVDQEFAANLQAKLGLLEEAEALCDRVAVIDHGRLIALDTIPALIAAHGGHATLRLTLSAPAPGTLADVKGVTSVRTDGAVTVVGGTGAFAQAVLSHLAQADVVVQDMETHSPGLEEVFLNLTGRALREA